MRQPATPCYSIIPGKKDLCCSPKPLHYLSIPKPIMIEGLVSVIMPTYNSGKYLADSIESVLNQTYQHLELLITDDCSSDADTIDLLKKYQQEDNRVKVVFLKENGGPGVARNNSIERAQGQYIAFCDSDDRWVPNKLEIQLAFMKENRYALCCSSYIICDENSRNIGVSITPARITYGMMKRDDKVGCLTAIYDVKALGRKYFMPTMRKRQDWAFFLNLMADCKEANGIKEPLAFYRRRTNSVSSSKLSLVKFNIAVYRQCLGFSKVKSVLYFAFCFMPTYTVKVLKQLVDSYKFTHC